MCSTRIHQLGICSNRVRQDHAVASEAVALNFRQILGDQRRDDSQSHHRQPGRYPRSKHNYDLQHPAGFRGQNIERHLQLGDGLI